MAAREEHVEQLAGEIRRELIQVRRGRAARGELDRESIDSATRRLLEERAGMLSPAVRSQIEQAIRRDTVGLGPLETLLADPEIEEVMINRHDSIYVERSGRVEPTEIRFDSAEQLRDVIERILAPLGRRVDELSPMADARLADGSRVNVVIPPLAVDGPVVSIRRFTQARPSLDEMAAAGSMSDDLAATLVEAVSARRNILISGGTGAGKTTVLNALSRHIDETDRVVTIEDAAELKLLQSHVVRLESRPATVEGRGEVTIRDLLRNALRMRPDRLILGEVRGVEALDLLTALNTGHRGAMSTVHANSPADALRRLENLALMAGVGLPHAAIRDQLIRGLDLIIQLERRPDGSRGVSELAEVVSVAGGAGTRRLAGAHDA